jgi:hypothetical protein
MFSPIMGIPKKQTKKRSNKSCSTCLDKRELSQCEFVEVLNQAGDGTHMQAIEQPVAFSTTQF